MKQQFRTLKLAGAVALAFAAADASASEGGSSVYPNGLENYMVGAIPPPGLYGIVYGYYYDADKLIDNSGHDVAPPNFHVQAEVIAPRLIWVPNVDKIWGGQLAVHAVLPLSRMDVRAGGESASQFAQGDVLFGAGLGYHYSEKLHAVYAVDFFAPTGKYDVGALDNTGSNHWMIQPVLGLDYIDPAGFNASAKVMYGINLKNHDTDYTSGQEFVTDYALGWGVGHGWVVGVGGFVYQQTTNDKQYGETIRDYKGRSYAFGPSVKYDSGKGWLLTGKFEPEFDVRNRAEGSVFTVKFLTRL